MYLEGQVPGQDMGPSAATAGQLSGVVQPAHAPASSTRGSVGPHRLYCSASSVFLMPATVVSECECFILVLTSISLRSNGVEHRFVGVWTSLVGEVPAQIFGLFFF